MNLFQAVWGVNRADEVFVRIGLSAEDPRGKEWTKIEGNMKTIRCEMSVLWDRTGIKVSLLLSVWGPQACAGPWIRMTQCGEEQALGETLIREYLIFTGIYIILRSQSFTRSIFLTQNGTTI